MFRASRSVLFVRNEGGQRIGFLQLNFMGVSLLCDCHLSSQTDGNQLCAASTLQILKAASASVSAGKEVDLFKSWLLVLC